MRCREKALAVAAHLNTHGEDSIQSQTAAPDLFWRECQARDLRVDGADAAAAPAPLQRAATTEQRSAHMIATHTPTHTVGCVTALHAPTLPQHKSNRILRSKNDEGSVSCGRHRLVGPVIRRSTAVACEGGGGFFSYSF